MYYPESSYSFESAWIHRSILTAIQHIPHNFTSLNIDPPWEFWCLIDHDNVEDYSPVTYDDGFHINTSVALRSLKHLTLGMTPCRFTDDGTRYVPEEVSNKRIARFIGSASSLESLSIDVINGYVRADEDFMRVTWDLDCIFQDLRLPALKKLRVDDFNMTRECFTAWMKAHRTTLLEFHLTGGEGCALIRKPNSTISVTGASDWETAIKELAPIMNLEKVSFKEMNDNFLESSEMSDLSILQYIPGQRTLLEPDYCKKAAAYFCSKGKARYPTYGPYNPNGESDIDDSDSLFRSDGAESEDGDDDEGSESSDKSSDSIVELFEEQD